ncbi:globin [Marinomonas agarivorans]|nr:globin [Marinomonas agarivorans]
MSTIKADSSSTTSPNTKPLGHEDGTLLAVGGEIGLHQLVVDFFHCMATEPQFKRLHAMHPADTELSIDKLYRFLTGWMGGEKLYRQKYGSIHLPISHRHLDLVEADQQSWLDCMAMAMEKQHFSPELQQYLLTQLSVPAQRVTQASLQRQQQSG